MADLEAKLVEEFNRIKAELEVDGELPELFDSGDLDLNDPLLSADFDVNAYLDQKYANPASL